MKVQVSLEPTVARLSRIPARVDVSFLSSWLQARNKFCVVAGVSSRDLLSREHLLGTRDGFPLGSRAQSSQSDTASSELSVPHAPVHGSTNSCGTSHRRCKTGEGTEAPPISGGVFGGLEVLRFLFVPHYPCLPLCTVAANIGFLLAPLSRLNLEHNDHR